MFHFFPNLQLGVSRQLNHSREKPSKALTAKLRVQTVTLCFRKLGQATGVEDT